MCVITLSDPADADFGVTLSQPTRDRAPGALEDTMPLLADGQAPAAHPHIGADPAGRRCPRQLESGNLHEHIILTLQ
jgi:hypothetical protein